MAPHAHLAIYKACGSYGCQTSTTLAGMDAAIKDGLDVMSLSLGGSASTPFYEDATAVAAISAIKKGISASFAIGNRGPFGSLNNDAPWILTVRVGVSAMDRNTKVILKLGDRQKFNGESAFHPMDFPSTMLLSFTLKMILGVAATLSRMPLQSRG
ncbi:subtilisin-like protease 4 [Elaeis guineensis]|uniref:subtilisin-like protease 4 n=1 Tax=Elaeis guineensis var. tenera TaxID=51953 RepID=UPI003C6CF997